MRPATILFVSSNWAWGGSEFLWAQTAAALAEAGHRVRGVVNYGGDSLSRIFPNGPPFPLRAPWGGLIPGDDTHPWTARLMRGTAYRLQPFSLALRLALGQRPDLAVISQGANFDGARVARACIARDIPYVLISHRASEQHWVVDYQIEALRQAFEKARRCYFVSENNLGITEWQIGRHLLQAEVVRNPYLVAWNDPPPWPASEAGFRLACVARLWAPDKGQDLLLRAMAQPHWRERPVTLTFHGSGLNEQALRGLATLLNLSNVSFAGETDDITAIWRGHHAVVMPSRAEGLPITLVEAMLSNRVPIVTDVGGAREIVQDNESGFISPAPTVEAFSEAMERAWQRRAEWQAIGERAGARARALIPEHPQKVMADKLLALLAQGSAP